MFDLDQFIAECEEAVKETDSHMAVKELVGRAVSNPDDVLKGLGEPSEAGVNKLFVSDNLTILNLVWGPMMTLKPHDHKMWAVIGIYTGREDNIFWRKIKDGSQNRIEAAGAEAAGAEAGTVPEQAHSRRRGTAPRRTGSAPGPRARTNNNSACP